MDSSIYLGNNPLYLLDQLAEHPLISPGESKKLTPKARNAEIYEKLEELEKNLDFFICNQKTFGGFPKKFKKILRKISDEIAKDKEAAHKLALKAHKIFSKIVAADLLTPADIPANIVEANYVEKAGTAGTDPKHYSLLPSVIDLTQLAGTSKQEQVENDFINYVNSLHTPLPDNSSEVGNLYTWLDIAAEKNYPGLLNACLAKLTTKQIMVFLSAPYVLQKQAIKDAVIKDLKNIQTENPAMFNHVFDQLTAIDQSLPDKEFPTKFYTNLESEIIDLASVFDQKELLQKIFTKLSSYHFEDLSEAEELISKIGFADFAKLFAVYYSLSYKLSQQDANQANKTLNALILKILKNKSNRPEIQDDEFEDNTAFSWSDRGLLKQLISSLLDFYPMHGTNKKSSERKLVITQPVTLEDLRTLNQFYQNRISMTKDVFDRIPIRSRFYQVLRNPRLTEVRKIIPDFNLLQNSV